MSSLETHSGDVRYKAITVPVAPLSSDSLPPYVVALREEMSDFSLAGQTEGQDTTEWRNYEGARRQASIQLSKDGLAMVTNVDRKGGVSFAKWQDCLGQYRRLLSRIGWKPGELKYQALVYTFVITPPRTNNYEWLLRELTPNAPLRGMVGDRELFDFDITLRFRRPNDPRRMLLLEVGSNQESREIAARDFSDEQTRVMITCHHVIRDFEAVSGAASISDVLGEQHTELCEWLAEKTLLEVERLAAWNTAGQ